MRPANATISVSALVLFCAGLWAGCDSGFSGDPFENQPPNTSLSVRDTSLVDNLEGADRFTSTVYITWSGDDPDGFVQSYEIRFYDELEKLGPEDGWSATTSTDSLVLLPIPRGEREANIAFEVRAIDDLGAKDPTPARTVFPIENGPPSIRFSPFDLPPDTTFSVISAAWTASDPEGAANIRAIQIGLNDSLNLVDLPFNTEFITLTGQIDINDASQVEVDARVYLGRGYTPSDIFIPGLKLNAVNTLYIRAVDATDTTSTLERISWYTKKQTSEVLYVDDFRTTDSPTLAAYHLNLLREYLPAGAPIDLWTITTPFVTGSAGLVPRSDQLPPNANPTVRQMLAQFKYIYWMSTNTTVSQTGDNLPFVAGVMDIFFGNGGKLMVHSPIALPPSPDDNLGNAAILLLPLTDLITFPEGLRSSLRLFQNAPVDPLVVTLPGTGEPMPALVASATLLSTLPYVVGGSDVLPIYSAAYRAISSAGSLVDWDGPTTIASISTDQRVGLFALPMINSFSGQEVLIGADGDTAAPRRAIHLMLESLGFPK
ncbi:MAG: hypothetical protein E2O84_08465 [Bacteroidetes bacterium]|nr:MAG: hypothetical protein E2O84_08465 [Bacteroidota bacterium]